jgi:ribA/ribD-fused uncharacterized protein
MDSQKLVTALGELRTIIKDFSVKHKFLENFASFRSKLMTDEKDWKPESLNKKHPGMAVIQFYSETKKHGHFSNFFPSEIKLKIGKNDLAFPTSEHLFQIMKFVPENGIPNDKKTIGHIDKIYNTESPGISAKLGRMRNYPICGDWETFGLEVMFFAVYLKFTQDPNLKKKILETEGCILVEHTHRDAKWGDGGDINNCQGQNLLGTTLMFVREFIK